MFKTESEQETKALGEQIGKLLLPGDTVLLQGDLGTGKSVIARGLALGLGVNEIMPSPTFTIMFPYTTGKIPLYHFDLYRIEDSDEFYECGFDEYFDKDGVCLVEWPNRVDFEPLKGITITLARGCAFDERLISVTPFGDFKNAEQIKNISGWQ